MPCDRKPILRLPRKLAYTTIGCTVVGALACSSSSQGKAQPDASADAVEARDAHAETSETLEAGPDAATDAPEEPDAPTDAPEAYDSPSACDDGAISFCGPAVGCNSATWPCPLSGAYYCVQQCPPGCEPFA